MKKKHLHRMYLLVVLALISYAIFNLNLKISVSVDVNYAISSPIVITSDIELISHSSSGNGSKSNPYILSNFEIYASGEIGISISSTTCHFLIIDCLITDGNFGIYIYNVAPGTANVVNNECIYSSIDGIYVESSPGVNITGNTVSSNTERGIRIIDCSNSIIDKNIGNYCGRSAINIQFSDYVNITNNYCEGNSKSGIYIRESLNCRITDNVLINNYTNGIFPSDSAYSTIVNNSLINCGIYVGEDTLSDLFSYTIQGNVINSKEFGWYENLTSTVLDNTDIGQLALVNCSDIVVKNHNINSASSGLTLYFCTDIDVFNNIFNHHSKTGLEVRSSSNINIYQNEINFSHQAGVKFLFSSNVNFSNNLCSYSHAEGLSLYNSNNNLLYSNLFESNIEYGIFVTDFSINNYFYYNSFVNNSFAGTSQGYDSVIGNQWFNDSTSIGNFWSEWISGTYLIDGSAGASDLYPNLCNLIYDDIYEDNEDFLSAPLLIADDVYSLRAFDDDYFKVFLNEDLSYNILLSYDASNINLDLFLYNEYEELLVSSTDDSSIDEISSYICDFSSYYYIVIEITEGHKGLSYLLEIDSYEIPVSKTYSASIFLGLIPIISLCIILIRSKRS